MSGKYDQNCVPRNGLLFLSSANTGFYENQIVQGYHNLTLKAWISIFVKLYELSSWHSKYIKLDFVDFSKNFREVYKLSLHKTEPPVNWYLSEENS